MESFEKIGLQAQDETEWTHWTPKQVTLHPIFIVDHAHKRTIDRPNVITDSIWLYILSDNLVQDTNTVFVFSQQQFIHL